MIQFDLPKERIAQEPARPRDSARLLVYNRHTKQIQDDIFRNIGNHLAPNTTIVVNNSKVEQCRWLFDDGKTEIFVLEKVNPHTIVAMVRPGKKFKSGMKVQLTDSVSAHVLAVLEDGTRTIELSVPHDHPSLAAHNTCRFLHIFHKMMSSPMNTRRYMQILLAVKLRLPRGFISLTHF